VRERHENRAVGGGGGPDDEPGHERGQERGGEARQHQFAVDHRQDPGGEQHGGPGEHRCGRQRALEHGPVRDERDEALAQACPGRGAVQDRGAHLDGGHAGCLAVRAFTCCTRAEIWNGLAR
jgi:hypothetical protein